MVRVPVEPLTDDERREIIRDVPSLSAKTLDDAQVALLLDNPGTRNPLFLLVALEELRAIVLSLRLRTAGQSARHAELLADLLN